MTSPVEILLVEDEPAAVRLTQAALQRTGIEHHLHVAKDGDEALAFLRHEAPHAEVPRPDLVLLDLNLPTVGGLDVLSIVKGDEGLRTIPVVVLTTSDAELDVVEAYARQASGYLTKPIDFQELIDSLKCVCSYWFVWCRRPTG